MLFVNLWVLVLLIIISAADMKHMMIPDVCILLLLPAALFSSENLKGRMAAAASVWMTRPAIAIISATAMNSFGAPFCAVPPDSSSNEGRSLL